MPHCMVGNCVQYEGNKKCGNDRMGLEHNHSLSSAKAFSHSTVHLKNFTCSIGKAVTCNFLKQQVHYLGHIIFTDEVAPDPSKIKQITDQLVPRTVQEVQQLLGLADYYHRFIQNFARITKLLLVDDESLMQLQGRF